MVRSAFVACSFLLAACYGSAPPPPPKIPLPPVVDGAPIEVESHDKTTVEDVQREARTCAVVDQSEKCSVTKYKESVPVTRTYTRATYAGQPLNYAQLRVMSDPEYDAKVARIAELGHTCRRANVPRYLGLLGVVGGIVVANIGAAGKNPNVPVEVGGFAMIGGGIASYATGYYAFGGRDCVRARALYNELDLANKQWEVVVGGDYAAEMKALAERFNAAHRAVMGMRR
jgi:hypothetical protein